MPCPFAGGPRGQVIKARHHFEVLPAGENGVYGGRLAGEPHDVTKASLIAPDIVPGHSGLAAIHIDEGGENAHEGRFSGPVRAEESEYGGRFDVDVNAREGLYVAVRFRHAAHRHGRLRCRSGGRFVFRVDQN